MTVDTKCCGWRVVTDEACLSTNIKYVSRCEQYACADCYDYTIKDYVEYKKEGGKCHTCKEPHLTVESFQAHWRLIYE